MKKILLCLFLALCLLLSPLTVSASAANDRNFALEESLASSLKALGLFQGQSDIGLDFALDRAPTRTEALVMLLRLLGVEETALTEQNSHPFQDTASYSWADPYIAYAYAHGLTKGQSAVSFGGTETADARTYLTFVLRALGYEEGEGADFVWDNPYALARKCGILPGYVQSLNFMRGDVVSVSYAALSAPCKDGSGTLAQALTAKGMLTEVALADYYDPQAVSQGKLNDTVAKNVEAYMRPYLIAGGIDISGLTIKNYGSVALVGDAAYELYGFYAGGAQRCAQQVRNAAEALADKARVFGIVVPNRLGAVLTATDFSRLCSSPKTETEAIAYAYENMGSDVITVDAMSELRVHNLEDIFFRTDHHWTALGAYYAYVAWAESAGFTPVSLNDFTTLDMPGHLGLFYSMCGNPWVMKQNPDTVTAYIPKDIDGITVEIQESNGSTHSGQLIYDYTNSAYKYGAFLGGDHPLTTITNDRIQDDSACVLVKDSYGNPFAVYLTQHYHTVYVVDYRYYKNVYNHLTFSRFAEERGVDDFIVLMPMTLSQSDSTANYLSRYCK